MAVCAPAAAPSTVTHSEIDDDLVLVHKNLPVYIPFNLFISHPRGAESPAAANQRAPLPLRQWQAGVMYIPERWLADCPFYKDVWRAIHIDF